MEAEGPVSSAPDDEPACGTSVPAAIAALEVAAGSATVATPESLRPFVAPEASVAEEVKEEAVDFDPEEECNIVGDFLGSVGV